MKMVHWVSHPPEQGRKAKALFPLDEGLFEGLTQVVTENLISDQGIRPYSKPIYAERVDIVRKLIERFGIDPFGAALFGGQLVKLTPVFNTYGPAGMGKIRQLANMNDAKEAIRCIDNLNRAADARKAKPAGR